MDSRPGLWIPLAPLFTTLLAGCNKPDYACGDGGPYSDQVLLTPAEYEQWQQGKPPGSSTTGDPTTGDPIPTTGPAPSTTVDGGTSGETSGSTSTGETGGSTAADTAGTTGSTMLTDQEICNMVCDYNLGGGYETCTIEALDSMFSVRCEGVGQCMAGRRHACVRSHGATIGSDPPAIWLALAAHDEAASVHAFLALGAELRVHGAPAELLARITAAADDERRHAALITELALRHGATVPTPLITPTPTRDLLTLAIENIVEGCIGETWAALVAAHQARHAHTPELRDLYAGIAADETDHAELAWSIHTWLFGQLEPSARALVAAARRAAGQQLAARLATSAEEPALLALGVPDRRTALRLLGGLEAALWSAAA